MNAKNLFAALLVTLTVGAGFNQTAVAADDNGPKTRAQVFAELKQARADGSFYSGGEGTPRRQTRARLAEQEKASRASVEAAGTRGSDPTRTTPQRAGS